MNTDEIKKEIAKKAPFSRLAKEFDPPLTSKDRKKMRNFENWNFMFKEEYLIAFNCEPFDDQLRCYVKLNQQKEIIDLRYEAE